LTLPNVLLIGAQKAATTTLWFGLKNHPDAFFPDRKELMFFLSDELYSQGPDAYARWFQDWSGQRVVGEGTPCMHSEGVAKRMADVVPQARLIASLRDPIERAYSSFCMQLLKGSEPPGRTFEEAIERDASYLDFGRYIHQLRALEEYYPRSRMHVLLDTDLKERPDATWRAIHEFLEIEHIPVQATARANVGGKPKSRVVSRAVYLLYKARNRMRATPLAGLVNHPWLDQHSRELRNYISRWNRSSGRYPALCADRRAALLPHVREDIEALEVWLDRDLSSWREV